ncbi:MAG: ROK family protein [Clostridium sp.]
MFACLDIGGTSIKVAVGDKLGGLKEHSSLKVSNDIDTLMATIVEWIEGIKEKYTLEGIAISAPGAVNSETGIIGGDSAVPCIHGPNWKEILLEKTGLNVSIENDANCAALAEVFSGTAKDVSDMMFVVCGTGIGGAIIKNGEIHKGKNLFGGEFGYMLMDNDNGRPINFSEYASTMSFVRKVRNHYDDESWDGKKVFEEAEKGNKYCIEAIDTFYLNLARGIFNLQHIYDPEMILLGGSISDREDFAEKVREKLEYIISTIDINCITPNIATCTHKKDANLVGALANHIKEYKIW